MNIYISYNSKKYHIVLDEYGSIYNNKIYETVCGNVFSIKKTDNFTTIGANGIIHNVCEKCVNMFKSRSFMSPNQDPRLVKTSYYFNDVIDINRFNIAGPKVKYKRVLSNRRYPLLSRLKQNVKRNSK